MTTLYENAFRTGSRIEGKWNGRVYIVERQLGAGANGLVMLVSRGRSQYALKAGFETIDHQSEINVLKTLSGGETSFRHYLVDVDDFVYQGKTIPFSVLRYIDGATLSTFLQKNGPDWIFVIGTKLLKKLTELHGAGFVFGDLKLENMLISGYGDVELIDFGGVTPKGNSIKQLTEVYDRGYWGMGSRVAEESYDLFAFAILILNALDKQNRFASYRNSLPQNRNKDDLLEMIRGNPHARTVSLFLTKALTGEISSSREAFRLWKSLIVQSRGRSGLHPVRTPWLKVSLAASLLLFGITVYRYLLY
ncbi:protein kinase domain-containing protein [Paenibacillus eucommiae]|uniref:Serine/threonine-protein kinase n=1 Tax=Paenibacillus eucommiae TaxID=1355755 RepID=A0ABS4JA77_9BACL|nr:serine/threonine protein kinase [Paenibacillus eucommiae]MBP1996160.1 serine/threonine-protein kinase [Paenibacillus eucommiae]